MLSTVTRLARSLLPAQRSAASAAFASNELLALFHPTYAQTKDKALQAAVDKYGAALKAAGLDAGSAPAKLAEFARKFAAENADVAAALMHAPVQLGQEEAARRKALEGGDVYFRDVQLVWDALAASGSGSKATLAGFQSFVEKNADVSGALQRIRRATGSAAAEADASTFKKPVRVAVTGAAGAIGYSLLFRIATGEMLGKNQPVILHLVDLPAVMDKLKGTVMELDDCAFPLLSDVVATSDLSEGFKDIKFAMLVGARPRSKGMERADLLTANAEIFSEQGKALNKHAHPTVKVVVVGNPANTNALIAQRNAPELNADNFTAMTRLDQNRAIGMLAKKLKVPVTAFDRFALWGNHSPTMYPDVSHATVNGEWLKPKVDQKWYADEFIPRVGKRGAEIIEARGASSAASAASAAVDHMRNWHLGSNGQWVSMGVPSDGSYGIDAGIIYSVPVVCENGEYRRVHGLPIDPFSAERMEVTRKELEQEKEMIKHLLPAEKSASSTADAKKRVLETSDPAERDRLYGELKAASSGKKK